ncbi:ornithine cyclodeaminase family protein [Congregibacter litoralis]|uniref:Putative ornithine cyclodeaminase, mu-crystallin-like protein n=1 Tax=Congregibacter litoralis KT71 TaxID=314285 RepID=A4A9T0_9GAMM|nr:ornithine cyclodeaminase [Congregibacter litoralis]EAQ97247.2 putative ornithine cyclodeaminase, mu-crystallin-like protein [Congregibacter litoralis KT71]
MALTLIDAAQVAEILPMADCIEVMRDAMMATSAGTVEVPPRQAIPVGDGHTMLFMPGSAKELGYYGTKVITLHSDNPSKGKPAIQGSITIFDYDTGEPVAIIDGSSVTGLRTAAASGLATDCLARKSSASLGIFGCGLQAGTHIDAIRAVRPIEKVLVWGRNLESAEVFAKKETARTGLEVQAVSDPSDAAACDVLCTVTGSAEPILFGDCVTPGTHINLVGSHSLNTREADTRLIQRSRLYVDAMQSTRNEGGNIMIPLGEGAIDEGHILGEIGELAAGSISGRTDDDQVTVYSSLGMTSQDLFAAVSIYERYKERG